ncbi:MAG: UDP-N-acetylmuramate--L-alanine ligase [Candidatus Omnitrophota bacterium]
MKKIHFIGIGGIGMSALADIHLAKGGIVTGSDLRPNSLTDELCKKGAVIYKGHDAENIPEDADLVVRSTCIRDENPEIKKARHLGVPVILRGEMLKELIEEVPLSIAVTGTHGKTTTSALVAHITEHCGKDPTVVVGGEMSGFGGNAKFGRGNMIVSEVDESDGYFRNISAQYAVVTNIEREHMENYGSLEKLIDAYREFIGRIPADGFLVFNGEDPVLGRIAGDIAPGKLSFGIDGDFDVTCRRHVHANAITFDLLVRGKNYGRVSSPLIGRYNLMNILAAIAVCMQVGLDFDRIAEAVSSFHGVKRRFDSVGRIGNIEVIEDYAHHPTELRSVIAAARDRSSGRIVTIFQPHRYSRTRDLMREFSDCFYDSDILILTDIYSADEDVIEEVAVRDMYEMIDRERFQTLNLVEKKDIPGFVSGLVRQNDTILVLGAGDISEISGNLVKRIEEKTDAR